MGTGAFSPAAVKRIKMSTSSKRYAGPDEEQPGIGLGLWSYLYMGRSTSPTNSRYTENGQSRRRGIVDTPIQIRVGLRL